MSLKPVCQSAHPLIASGACPWCEQPVIDGQLRPEVPLREVAIFHWDTEAMLRALDSEDPEGAHDVASNLLCHCPDPGAVLAVFRKALASPHSRVPFMAVNALRHHGSHMSCEQAAGFEQAVEAEPDDRALRLLLLGYYARHARMVDADRQAQQRHTLWVVEHAPELVTSGSPVSLSSADGAAYDQARRSWLRQLEAEPDNLTLLGNAAQFFYHPDPGLCETLLRKAQALDPTNPEWPRWLGSLYRRGLHARSGESFREAAAKSFAAYTQAYALEGHELKRFWWLPELARAALEAGAGDEARSYATELLRQAEQPGYFQHRNGMAVFYGHLVLGRLALRDGDVAAAKEHLLASGKTTGSPTLNSGGPNMTLAKELLDRGEREVVVQFLNLCTNFWQTDDHRAEQWAYAIVHGQVPDFGPNLDY